MVPTKLHLPNRINLLKQRTTYTYSSVNSANQRSHVASEACAIKSLETVSPSATLAFDFSAKGDRQRRHNRPLDTPVALLAMVANTGAGIALNFPLTETRLKSCRVKRIAACRTMVSRVNVSRVTGSQVSWYHGVRRVGWNLYAQDDNGDYY